MRWPPASRKRVSKCIQMLKISTKPKMCTRSVADPASVSLHNQKPLLRCAWSLIMQCLNKCALRQLRQNNSVPSWRVRSSKRSLLAMWRRMKSMVAWDLLILKETKSSPPWLVMNASRLLSLFTVLHKWQISSIKPKTRMWLRAWLMLNKQRSLLISHQWALLWRLVLKRLLQCGETSEHNGFLYSVRVLGQ